MKTPNTFLATALALVATISTTHATVLYVNVNSATPAPPYTTWATAATNIQDAANAAGSGDEIVVTNGTYTPVTVNTPLLVQSVNGPGGTVIDGGGAAPCVYLTNNAVLVGFTLTNGSGGVYCEDASAVVSNCVLTGNSSDVGGGAYGGTLNNCTLTGNSAISILYFGGYGGGAYGSTLNNCTLTGNSASLGVKSDFTSGGGAAYCMLNNCTLTGDSAVYGGGAYDCTLNNCIDYYNGPYGGNYDASSTLNYCCTTPLPSGIGNITNAPLFVDYAGGNVRLQSNSPCINSGNNAYVVGSTDLDGNPRIVGGTVDIGAYEYQTPTSILSYAWLQQYGLPTDGSADYADTDGTGQNNLFKYVAGLDPTNPASVFVLNVANASNQYQAMNLNFNPLALGRTYTPQFSTDLAGGVWLPLTTYTSLLTNGSQVTITDTNPIPPQEFYRIDISLP
jgi:hypothetical protein